MNFDEQTSLYIQKYLIWTIPGLFGMMLFNTIEGYLYVCNIFAIQGYIETASTMLYWIISYFFIEKWDLAIEGAAIAWNIMYILAAGAVFVYIKRWNPIPETFFWFCKDSFQEL